MTTPTTPPRDDFYGICGVAAALMVAVVLGITAPGGQPAAASQQATAAGATSPTLTLMASMLQDRPLVDTILRGETLAYGH